MLLGSHDGVRRKGAAYQIFSRCLAGAVAGELGIQASASPWKANRCPVPQLMRFNMKPPWWSLLVVAKLLAAISELLNVLTDRFK
jgi:hypothetical protein